MSDIDLEYLRQLILWQRAKRAGNTQAAVEADHRSEILWDDVSDAAALVADELIEAFKDLDKTQPIRRRLYR